MSAAAWWRDGDRAGQDATEAYLAAELTMSAEVKRSGAKSCIYSLASCEAGGWWCSAECAEADAAREAAAGLAKCSTCGGCGCSNPGGYCDDGPRCPDCAGRGVK